MKKTISIILAFAIIISTLSFSIQALESGDDSDYPVIIVPGYSSSALVCTNDDGTVDQVWGVDWDLVLKTVLANIVKLGKGVGELTKGNADYIASTVGKEFYKMFEKLRCNPDGSSVYNLSRKMYTAYDTNDAVLAQRYENDEYLFEPDFYRAFQKYTSADNVYSFNSDFRMGAEYCAGQLDEYIQQVKEYSGKGKVNLFAVSHGGQVTGTYLSLYGYKEDVNNAVMTVPALSGAGAAYDALSNNMNFDEECLARFIEHGLMCETDYDWLVKAQQLGFLDDILKGIDPYLVDVAGYWGSLWDFIPTEFYEELKDKMLDDTLSAQLIKKSDRMHYEIMPSFYTAFKKCRESYGINVSIIAGTDNDIVTGLQQNSDGIITVKSTTGATVADWNTRFSDGYIQKEASSGYKVSPSMEIDASTAYLPDNTWFVEGLFHGMTIWDDYTKSLIMNLLFSNKIKDVNSDKDFPQFHATTNCSSTVFAKFNKSVEGYVSGNDTALSVTNISKKYSIKLTSINCNNINIGFNIKGIDEIPPGETVEIPFTGNVQQISIAQANVTVGYFAIDSPTPVGERKFNFTIMNGDNAEYDEQNPLTSVSANYLLDKFAGNESVCYLKSKGLYEITSIVFNVLNYWIDHALSMLIN